jgi:asparagine synthase (glutamine-hydrolysing)
VSADFRLRPTPLEIAAGVVFGADDETPPLPVDVAVSPHEALRNAIRAGLNRPPCVVAFSGGRDSSAMLALACDVARKEGLPLPVPVTMRFPGVAEADETRWQELVVRHLRLSDWVRLEFADELDYVGPWAQRVLRKHGVLWPANDYVDLPLLEQAEAGSFVDGVDGDSVFSSSYLRLMQTMRGRRKPGRRALRDALFLLKSRTARERAAYRGALRLPWLTPAAQDDMRRRLAVEFAAEPFSYAERVRWYHRSRYLSALRSTTELFATEYDVAVVRPLVDPTFLSALARSVGALGFKGRSATMDWLFGDVLPAEVVNRETKASFPHYWGEASRRLAAEWDGDAVDENLVDRDALRRVWRADQVDHRSALLIQSVWLARDRGQSIDSTANQP